jgi:uncharacterized protein
VSNTPLLITVVFCGSAVTAFAGFAGLAGAGAVLLQFYPPQLVLPLVMLCSVGTQLACFVCLRTKLDWHSAGPLILGGVCGVPLAVYLLDIIDPHAFRQGFGTFLVAYVAYMAFRPQAAGLPVKSSPVINSLVGFTGGLVGGLTAMPSAVPTLWCDLRGLSKDQQRGIVQPFMVAMQALAALLLMGKPNAVDGELSADLLVTFPALCAGTWLGLRLFGRLNDRMFRKVVLGLLLFSGLALVR